MDIFVNKNTVYNNIESRAFRAQYELARSLLSRVLTYPNFDADSGHQFEVQGWKNVALPAANSKN